MYGEYMNNMPKAISDFEVGYVTGKNAVLQAFDLTEEDFSRRLKNRSEGNIKQKPARRLVPKEEQLELFKE